MGDQSASETKRRSKCERATLPSFSMRCSEYKKMQRKAFMTKRRSWSSALPSPRKKSETSPRKLLSCRVASFKENGTSALRVRNRSPGLRQSKSIADINTGLCVSRNSRYQWDRPFASEEKYSNTASYSTAYQGCKDFAFKRTGRKRTSSLKLSSSFCDSKNMNCAEESNCTLVPCERMEDSDDEDFAPYAVKDEWFSDADSDSYEILDAVNSDEEEEAIELCSDGSKVSISREVEVGSKFCPAKSEEESGASTHTERLETRERVEVNGLHITRVGSPTEISSGTSNVTENEQIMSFDKWKECHSINGKKGIPTKRTPASCSENICISDSQSSLCQPIYSETFVSSSSKLKLSIKGSVYDSEVPNACDKTEVLRTDISCPLTSDRKPVSETHDHLFRAGVSATFSNNSIEKAESACKRAANKQVNLPSSCAASFYLTSREVSRPDDNHSKAVTVTSENTKQCDHKVSPDSCTKCLSNVSIKAQADSGVIDSKVVLEPVKPLFERKKRRNYNYLDAVVAESAEIAAKKKKLAELVNARLKSSYFGKQDSTLELDTPSLQAQKVNDTANRVENSRDQDAACVTGSKQETVDEVSSQAFEPPNNISDIEVVHSVSENVTGEQTGGLYEDKQSKDHLNNYENSFPLVISAADGNDDDQRCNAISSYLNFDACSDELDSTKETRDDCYALIKRACLDADFGDGVTEPISECTSKQQSFFSGLAIQKAKPASSSENLATGRKQRVSYLKPCMLPFFDLDVPVSKAAETMEEETFCRKGNEVSHQSGYVNSMFSQESLSKSLLSPHAVSRAAAKVINVPKPSEKATAETCQRRTRPLWEKTRRELQHFKRNITNSSKQKAHLYGKLEKPEKGTEVCVSEGGITMGKRNREKRHRKFSAGTRETNFSKHHMHEQITVRGTGTTSKNSGDLKPNKCWNRPESLETGKKCDILEENEVIRSDNSLVKNNSENRLSSRMCADPERVLETWKKQIYMDREKSRDSSSIFRFSSVLSSFRIPKPPKQSQGDVNENPSDSGTAFGDQDSLSEATNSSTDQSCKSEFVELTKKKVRRIQKLPSDSEEDDPCVQKEKSFTDSDHMHKELRVCIEKLRFEDFPSNRTWQEVSIPSTKFLATPLKDCDPNITNDMATRFQSESAVRRQKSHLGRKRKRKLKTKSPKPNIREKSLPKSSGKREVLASTDSCPSPPVISLPDANELAPGKVAREAAETNIVVETRSTDSCHDCDDVTNIVSIKQGNPQSGGSSSKQLQTDVLCDDDDDDIQIIDIKVNRELPDRRACSCGEVADVLPFSSYSTDDSVESSSCGIRSNSFTFCIADVRSLDEHEWPAVERKSHSGEEFGDTIVECVNLEVHSSDISARNDSTDNSLFIDTSRATVSKSYTSIGSEVADTCSSPFASSPSCLVPEKLHSSLPTADYSTVDFLSESPAVLKAATNITPSSVISPEISCYQLRTKIEDDTTAINNDKETGNTADSPEHTNRSREGGHNECASGKNLIQGQQSNDTKSSVNCIVCGRQTASFCSRCFRRCCYHNFYSGCFLKHFTECRTEKVPNKP